MDQETATLLIKAGEVVILCLTLLLSVWWTGRNSNQNSTAMLQSSKMQMDTNASLTKSLDRLSDTWEASTDALRALREEVELTNINAANHNQFVANFQSGVQTAVKTMTETAERRDKQIAELPEQVAGRVNEVMSDELKKLPKEIVGEINPVLVDIAKQMDTLTDTIRLVVPEQIKALVTPEFEELKAKLNQLIDMMNKQQPEPTTDAAQPAEETKPNE